REGGCGQGAGVRRRARVRLAGDRDRRQAEAFGASERSDREMGGARRRRRDRPVDDALARARQRRGGRRGGVALMLAPLYTAEEMRAAEKGHDVQTMMERAGGAVAEAVLRRYPDARRVAAVCGKGANGGDGRIALRVLGQAGRETSEEMERRADVVIDA